jgi:hypothetical protein
VLCVCAVGVTGMLQLERMFTRYRTCELAEHGAPRVAFVVGVAAAQAPVLSQVVEQLDEEQHRPARHFPDVHELSAVQG